MFKWHKLGKVFDPADYPGCPWMVEFAQAPCVVHHDGFLRVYFSCRPSKDQSGQYVSRSSYVDMEPLPPFKVIRVANQPVLPLGDKGCFDEFGTYPISVIRDGEQFRAYYAGWTRSESVPFNVAIGLGFSTDGGKTFQKAGPGPILAACPDEPFILSGPKIRRFGGTWQLYYIAGRRWILDHDRPEPVYKLRMAFSEDGIRWMRNGQDLVPSRVEDDEAQASPDVFYHEGLYHMMFCFRYSSGYRGHEKGYRIGYAWSKDMLTWTRNDEGAGIDVSDTGWDSEMVSYPHVFQSGGNLFMFYLGNGVGRHGFGAAQLAHYRSPEDNYDLH